MNNGALPKNNDIGDGKEYSGAFNSGITTPEEDARIEENAPITKAHMNEILKELGNIFTQKMNLLEEQNLMRVNQLAADMQNAINQSSLPQPANKKEDLIQSIVEIGKEYIKKNQEQPENEFEAMIKERYKKEAMESIDIVSLINKKVKQSLVGKVANAAADDILVQTEPRLQHGP